MLPIAFAPHLWAATLRTLRELIRLAATALVLGGHRRSRPRADRPARSPTRLIRPAATAA